MFQTTNQLLIHRFLVTQTSNAPYLASPWNSLQAAVARAAAAAAEEVMESPSSVSENSMGEQGKNMEKPGETYGKIGEKRRFHLGLVCVFFEFKTSNEDASSKKLWFNWQKCGFKQPKMDVYSDFTCFYTFEIQDRTSQEFHGTKKTN